MAINIKTGWEWIEELLHPDAHAWFLKQSLSPALLRALEKPAPEPPSGAALERWRVEAEGSGYSGSWYTPSAALSPALALPMPEPPTGTGAARRPELGVPESQAMQRAGQKPEPLPVEALPGSPDYQGMLSEYMAWGYTRPELRQILEQGGMTSAGAGDASDFLGKYFGNVYGGAPPEGITPAEWRLYPGGWQARARTRMLLPEGMRKPEPGKWTEEIGKLMEMGGAPGDPKLMATRHQAEDYTRGELMASRQGMRSFFSTETVVGTWPGIPGEKEGTVMLYRDPEGPAQRIKVAKGIQRGLVYPQVELWRGKERVTGEGPRRVGPASTRPERGVVAPMVLLMEEWLPEGMMYLPRGFYTTATRRRVVDLFIPKGFTPEMERKGRMWAKGDEVKPFAGAAPVDLRIGKGWDRATLMDYSLEPEIRTRAVGQKEVREEGQRLRLVFGVAAGPDTARLSMKSLWAKFMAPMADTGRILGEEYAEHGISQIKDPTMLPLSWWHAQPLEERAAILSDIRGTTFTKEQVAGIPWQQAGREVAKHFRENILPDVYKEIPLKFRVHESILRLLPTDLLDMKKSGPVADVPEFWDIVTRPVPALVGKWWMDVRKGWGIRQPTLPYRELRVLERVAPTIYEDVMKRAKPIMDAYKAIIGGAVGRLPEGVEAVTPATEDVEKLFAMAEERASGAIVPESALQHALIESAAEIWGTTPLKLGEQGFLAGPAHARRFTAEGVFEMEEVNPFATAYAEALKALAGGKPEQVRAVFDRALVAQEKVASARMFFRSMLSAHLGPRATGDVVYGSDLLKPHEFTVPAGKALRAYGLKPGTREANVFLAKWQAGQIKPSALVWGYPTSGEDPFRVRIEAVHPETIKERAGKLGMRLSSRTPIQISAVLAEALGRDFDEDLVSALGVGELETKYGPEQLTGAPRPITGMTLKPPGDTPLATPLQIIEMADRRLMAGRGSHTRGAFLKPPPGIDRATWEGMEPQQRIAAALDPRNLARADAATFRESLNWMARLQANIGKYFNLLEDVQVVASRLDPKVERGLRGAADVFFETVHGRTQTPALLPPGLQEIMSRLATGTETGAALQELKGTGGEWVSYKGRLPGVVGLRQKLVAAMMGAGIEEGIPERLRGKAEGQWVDVVAKLAFPESSYEEARKAIAEFRQGVPGERSVRWSQLAGSAEEWATETPLGIVASAHLARRAQKRGGLYDVPEDTERELLEWAELLGARRAMLSKQPAMRLQGLNRMGDTEPIETEEQRERRLRLEQIQGKLGAQDIVRGIQPPTLVTPGEIRQLREQNRMGVTSEEATARIEESLSRETRLSQQGLTEREMPGAQPPGMPSPLTEPEWERVLSQGVPREQQQPLPRERRPSVRPETPPESETVRARREAYREFTAIVGGISATKFEETLTTLRGWIREGEGETLLRALPAQGEPLTPDIKADIGEWLSLRDRMAKMTRYYAEGRPSPEMLERIAGAEDIAAWPGFPRIEEARAQEKTRVREERRARIRGEAPAEPPLRQWLVEQAQAYGPETVPTGTLLRRGFMGGLSQEALRGVAATRGELLPRGVAGAYRGLEALEPTERGAARGEFAEGLWPEEMGRAASDLTQRLRDLGLTVGQADSVIGKYSESQEAVAVQLKEMRLRGAPAAEREAGMARLGAYERYFAEVGGIARGVAAGRITPTAFQERVVGAQEALAGTLEAAQPPQQPWWGGPQGPMGVEGPLRGPEKTFRYLTSYWNLMRMQRVWGMTGGAAMGQIPIAAGEEQAAGRAAMMTMPMGQFQQAPMAMDLMTYAAQQQRFRGQVGRAAYGAWGWAQQGALGGGLATAAGIGLPAVGAGAVAGLAAQALIPGLAATGVGIPVAAGLAAFGAARYAGGAMGDRERMAIAAARGPSFLARQREQMEQAPEWWQTLMLGRDQTFFGIDVGAQQRPEVPLAEYGQQILTGPLARLSPAARIAAIQEAVQTATEEGGPLEWMPPQAVSQQLAEWYRVTPGAEEVPPSQVIADPRFAAMAMRGVGPQAYAQIAQQWGMGSSGWERIQEVTGREPEAWLGTLQQYAPAARFGVTPEMVQERGWGGLEGQAQFQFQRLMAGDRGLWSQYAREGQAPAWMQTVGEYGMPIGTRALEPLRRSMLSRAVTPGMPSPLGVGGFGAGFGAAPAAIMREEGGMVPVLGGEAEIGVGGLWGLQDWRQEAQRAFEDWQTDFQQGSLDLQREYMLGGGEFGRGIRAIQEEMRDSQTEYQETQLGFQVRQIELQDQMFGAQMQLQREQAGVEAGWGREDIGRRYERGIVQAGWQEADLVTQLGRQQVGFGWQEQALARQQARQGIGFGWQEQALTRQLGRQEIGFGWQEDAATRQLERTQTGLDWQEQAIERQQERAQTGFDWQEQAIERQQERARIGFGWQEQALERQEIRQGVTFGWQEQALARQFGRQEIGFGWQEQALQRQQARQGITFGWQEQALVRQEARQGITFGWQEQALAQRQARQQMGFGWQEQALGRQWERGETQFGWAQEDLAFGRARGALQFGWQMEDVEENIRFATGRQRERLITQRERATVMYGMGEARAEEEEERLGQRREWAREDHETAREQMEARRQWTEEDLATALEQFEQRRLWTEEDLATALEQLEQRRLWAEEDMATALEQLEQRREWAREDHEVAREQLEQRRLWAEEDMATAREQLEQRRLWAEEDMVTALEQLQQRREWAQEDMATALEQLQQRREWAQEDYETAWEQIQQRREWAQEDYETAWEQIQQRREWAQEDYETAWEQIQQRRVWAQEDFDTQMERLGQRRAWLTEDHERELSRHNQRVEWANQRMALAEEQHIEQMQLARDRHSASVAHFNEQTRLQNELTRLQQAYWTAQHGRQQTAINKATEHRGILRVNEDLTLEATRQQQVAFRQYEQFFAAGGPFLDALDNILTKLQDISVEMAIR